MTLPAHRPLLVTADALLLDDLLRLAAATGVEVDVASDLSAARRQWATAPLVLLGHDLVDACRRANVPRRPGVALLGRDLDDGGVWQRAVEVGAEHVLFLPDAEPWLAHALVEAGEGPALSAPLLAVIGGCGGAGTTVLACSLAVRAARRSLSPVLLDGDPFGGGIDLVFGAEEASGLRWPDLVATRGRLPGAALSEALPSAHGVSLLSWGRDGTTGLPAEAARAALTAARRTAGVVVVDLPRSFGVLAEEVLHAASLTLLVVPTRVRAVAAAGRMSAVLHPMCADLALAVRSSAAAELRPSDVASALGLELAAELRPEPGLAGRLERGEPPATRARSSLAMACDSLLDRVGAGTSRSAA